MPNTVKIMTAVASKHAEPRPHPGYLYESTDSNEVVGGGRIYLAMALPPGGLPYRMILVNVATGSRHDDTPFKAFAAPRGFRRLPPGTVVTITVEED